MSDPSEDVIRAAVVRALARPLPWVLGLLSMWALAAVAGPLSILLAGVTSYLATVLASLLTNSGVEALPRRRARAALLAGAGVARKRPLPEDLRERYRRIHARVGRALELLPRFEGRLPIEPEVLAGVPEEFRRVARQRKQMSDDEAGQRRVEARLARMERSVRRLENSLAQLVRAEEKGHDGVEELEGAADEFEALVDLSREGFLDGR